MRRAAFRVTVRTHAMRADRFLRTAVPSLTIQSAWKLLEGKEVRLERPDRARADAVPLFAATAGALDQPVRLGAELAVGDFALLPAVDPASQVMTAKTIVRAGDVVSAPVFLAKVLLSDPAATTAMTATASAAGITLSPAAAAIPGLVSAVAASAAAATATATSAAASGLSARPRPAAPSASAAACCPGCSTKTLTSSC
jgi:hypothetical protein